MPQSDDYDSPWKDAIEHYFPEFLSFFFPLAHGEVDWSKEHVFLDQELLAVTPDAELGRRHVDKLVRVSGLGGEATRIFVHIEIQGEAAHDFAERMFVYNYRLYDRYRSPVASLAVLADDRPRWKPGHFTSRCLNAATAWSSRPPSCSTGQAVRKRCSPTKIPSRW